jgi:hypothetical protein
VSEFDLFPFLVYIMFLVILTMRTIVIWRHNRVISFLLPAILAAFWIPLLYFLNEALSSLVFGPAPRPDLPGCFLVTQKNILFVCFIIIMCFETCGFDISWYRWMSLINVLRSGARVDLV